MARNTRGQAEALIKLVGEDHVSELILGIEKNVAKVEETTERAAGKTGQLKKGWDRVATGADAVLNVFGQIVGMVDLAVQSIRKAGQADAIGRSFTRAAGGIVEASNALVELNRVTAGGVSTRALQSSATLAKRAGLDMEQTAALFKVATQAAIETGERAEVMVQRFTSAIADRSDSVFRALGVEVDFGQELQTTATQLGVATDALTEAQKRQIVFNRALDESRKKFGHVDTSIKTTVTALDELAAGWDDAKETMAGYLVTAIRVAKFEEGDVVKDLRRERFRQLIAGGLEATEVIAAQVEAQERATKEAELTVKAQEQQVALIEDLVKREDQHRLALIDKTTAMAEAALGMDLMVISARKWGAALDAATGDAEAHLKVLSRLAELGVVLGTDDVIRSQLGGDLPRPKKARGSGRAKRDDTDKNLKRSHESFKREMDRITEAANRSIQTALARVEEMDEDTLQAAAARRIAAIEAIAVAQVNSSEGAFKMAETFASAMGGTAASVANASAIITGELERITSLMKLFEAAGKSSSDGFIAAVPGMLSAGGKLVAGFVDNEQTKAGIMALMEGAAAIASFASQDYAAGALHTAAAIMYGLIAGGAIGGASGGGAASSASRASPTRPLSLGTPERDRDQGGGLNLTLNMSGATIIGGNREQAARDLVGLVERGLAKRSSGNLSEFVIG